MDSLEYAAIDGDEAVRAEFSEWLRAKVAILTPFDVEKWSDVSLASIDRGQIYLDAQLALMIGDKQLMAVLAENAEREGWQILRGGNPVFRPIHGTDPSFSDEPSNQTSDQRFAGLLATADAGLGQVVAVIDSGLAISHLAFSRFSLSDFKSLRSDPLFVDDYLGHGTYCCGVIGAGPVKGHVGIAPACRLVVGQLSGSRPRGEVTAVEFLALLSWAFTNRGARIVSFSYGAPPNEFCGDPRAMSKIIRAMRDRPDGALVFCATGDERNGPLMFPAACDGVIAVGGYELDKSNAPGVRSDLSGVVVYPPKEDFFLAPSVNLTTTAMPANGNYERLLLRFSDTSAACAYAAGVAVLYKQAFGGLTGDELVERMRNDAIHVVDNRVGVRYWNGIAFPPPKL